MEMNANNLFNDRDDNGDLLARYRLLWMDYGTRLKRYHPAAAAGGHAARGDRASGSTR